MTMTKSAEYYIHRTLYRYIYTVYTHSGITVLGQSVSNNVILRFTENRSSKVLQSFVRGSLRKPISLYTRALVQYIRDENSIGTLYIIYYYGILRYIFKYIYIERERESEITYFQRNIIVLKTIS